MKKAFSKFVKKLPIDFLKERKYDALIKKILRIVLEKDSSFIDVGCHRGDFLIEANKFAPNGSHIGFEPIPDIYEVLKNRSSHLLLLRNKSFKN